jgi:hypothetical protein
MNEQISEQDLEKKLTMDKINSLQNELGYYKVESKKPKSINEFLDESGNATWYVKNLTNTRVPIILERIERYENTISIEPNDSVNLLATASIEAVEKCQDLRQCFNQQILKRITPEEWLEYLTKKSENKKRAGYINKTEDMTKRTGIRIVVKSKVEKHNSFIKEGFGIDTSSFINWVQNEPLNEEEIEYCMSLTDNKDIRTILIHKKQEQLK